MKNKRKLSILSAILIIVSLMVGCGNTNKGDTSTPSTKKSKQETYNVGDTITISDKYTGKYELTITNVEEITERNKYSDQKVEQVIKVTYKYKLIENGESDFGLIVSDNDLQLVNADGETCNTYNSNSREYPKELKAPETSCTATAYYGLEKKSDQVSLIISTDSEDASSHAKITVDLNKA